MNELYGNAGWRLIFSMIVVRCECRLARSDSQVLPSLRVRCDEGPHALRDPGSGAANSTTRPASSGWIGPSWGFASREHDIICTPIYFHSASWPPHGEKNQA